MIQISTSPLITVVTVVYNGAALLDKTIQSVTTQRYAPIEYIVIDGASTDGTMDIVKKYKMRITKWLSEKDTGIYNAMNKGIRMASGEWICFLNCGDVFVDSESVGKVAEEIASDKANAAVIYGNILIAQADGTYKEKVAKEPGNLHRMFFCHQSAFVKTGVMRQYLFDERYKMSADLKFFKQCYYGKQLFRHLNHPLVVYDKSGISNTSRKKGLRENVAVVKEMDKGFDKILFLLRLYFVIYWRALLGKP
jgi:glycosyltransferase involved in cell wall biosynthesis